MPKDIGAVTQGLHAGLTRPAPDIASRFSNVFRPMVPHRQAPARSQASAPSGGGHWTVVIRDDDSGVNPYGSCDLVNGGSPASHNGTRQHSSSTPWLPRWPPQGSGGWLLICRL